MAGGLKSLFSCIIEFWLEVGRPSATGKHIYMGEERPRELGYLKFGGKGKSEWRFQKKGCLLFLGTNLTFVRPMSYDIM